MVKETNPRQEGTERTEPGNKRNEVRESAAVVAEEREASAETGASSLEPGAKSERPVQNIAFTVQYDGSAFHGWQRQRDLPTVQEALEQAIAKLTKEPCTLHGAGRTDTGVHALGQCAHFQTNSSIPVERWCIAINSILPEAVRVVEARSMPLGWHARFTPHWKHYRYTIERTSIGSPLRRNYVWQRHGGLDLALMRQASRLIVGDHNFQAFCASGSKVKNHWRSVRHAGWLEEGDLLHFDIIGNGFLYNMVRLLVGGMCDIGCGKWTVEEMAEALASGQRRGTLFCAPPQGLCLMEIFYEETANRLDRDEESV